MELSVRIKDITLKNPVTVASGTFGYGSEYGDIISLSSLGGIFTKAVTLEPREGNPGPRIVETTAGMLNAIGLANVGVDAFIEKKMPFLRESGTCIFVNVAGSIEDDYEGVVEKLEEVQGISGLEINISCPNVKHGGMSFGSNPKDAHHLIAGIRKRTSRLLIAKLSPNVTDITEVAQAAVDAGCDALSLINTLVGMAVNVKTRKPKLANITGGLSGPAIKPVGVAAVYRVAQKIKNFPLIGIGGIMNAADALEYIIAGATAVQIGTGTFVDPQIPVQVIEGIKEYGEKAGMATMQELIGSLQI